MSDLIIQKVQKRMLISLAEVSKEFDLHEGDFISIEERDGGIFLKPVSWHDKSQEYFWTDKWQEKMRKSKEALETGKFQLIQNQADLLKELGGKDADNDSDDPVQG
ncbi:transcriptional regulator [Cohnella kolymensis]|uniref:Transcriptional regulator n=1 Tax=Cohnella kolymensis TaxID=1590652 RepID=A0ABR5A9N2_9BACL|nr:AbrB/MazE/SpoVT family DNA-binding domain-containing protein [Cohnella kolymensis]KIL37553.1 transcriptional regulator [Cohnella kolymensis]